MAVGRGALTPGSEGEALLASMFTGAQHPAISYVTEITPIGLGRCHHHPCLNAGECTDMPPTEVDGQQTNIYTCRCSPSWLGVNCEESAEEAVEESALFYRENLAAPNTAGGGHRRTQGAEPEPEPEPDIHALITVSARGQTAALAHRNMEAALTAGPGADTSDGVKVGRRQLTNQDPAQQTHCGRDALVQENTQLRAELADWRAGRIQHVKTSNVDAKQSRRTLQAVVGDACAGGATITSTPGMIDFTQQYDNNADCSWLIQCTNGGTPQVDITAMETEANFDFISVLDGPGQNDLELLQASGSSVDLPATHFQASGNTLSVHFTSDGSVINTGFALSYSGCVAQGPSPPPPPAPPGVTSADQLNEFWAPAFQWAGAGADAKHILMCPDHQCTHDHDPCINHGVCAELAVNEPGGVTVPTPTTTLK